MRKPAPGETPRSRAAKQRRAAYKENPRVRPRDLDRLRHAGVVAESMRPIVNVAAEESRELIHALGGPDSITPQVRCLIEDFCAVGIVLRSNLATFLENRDPDLGSRISSAATVRRGIAQALGLERAEPKLVDLREYLAQRESEVSADDSETGGEN